MHRQRVGFLAAALLVAAAVPALAHTYPKTMEPAANSTVSAPPNEVVLNFTEALIPQFSSLEVVNGAGKRMDRKDAHVAPHDHARYIVNLSPLPPGKYKVIWRATSVDTHETHGSYDFTVKR